MRRSAFWVALAFSVGVAASCDDDKDEGEGEQCGEDDDQDDGADGDHDDDEEVGTPTMAVCPENSTLTYENFGKPFVEKYCTKCHSSTLVTCEERMGAPLYHDFDSLEGILPVAEHMDQMAAAGPASTNTAMPEVDPKPTLDERKKLGEWLRCELDKM